jgi:hypothetical protein
MVTGLAGFQLRKRTEATGRGKVGEEEHSANRTDEPHRCFLFLADVVFSSDTPFLPFLLRGNFLCNKREKIWMEKYIDDFFYRYTGWNLHLAPLLCVTQVTRRPVIS